jgi:hypothetical protein
MAHDAALLKLAWATGQMNDTMIATVMTTPLEGVAAGVLMIGTMMIIT